VATEPLSRRRTLPADNIPLKLLPDNVYARAVQALDLPRRAVAPQQERSLDSTRRLLDAAAELVAERGYTRATLAEIGARAGFSRGIVRARFGSKENLMWALVNRASRSWFDHLLDPPAEGTGLEQITAIVATIGRQVAADPISIRVLERLIFEATGELRQRFVTSQRQMHQSFADLFRRGVADGSVRPELVPELEASLLVAALRGISYEWFLYPEESPDVVTLHEGLAAALRERWHPR
jgi:AcrR family transcriptional regulator